MATAANAGKKAMLDSVLGQAGAWSLVLHTGADLTAASTTANITKPTFGGYADKPVTPGATSVNAQGVATSLCAAQTFAHNGTGGSSTVTHWCIADMGFGILYAFEKLTTSKTFSASGDTLTVTPTVTLGGNP